jgi:predicted ester cyclase
MATDLKTKFERIPLEILNQGKVQLIDELFAPEYVDRTPAPGVAATRDALKGWTTALRTAFPDILFTLDDSFVAGDKFVARLTASGTMKGDFAGMPATGKHATWTEIHILRLANERAVEHWGVISELTMMVQLGVIPAPGRVATAV